MENNIKIYTDGSCSGNPGPGGWAAVIIFNNDEFIITGYESNTTNNRMEIVAAIQGLKEIKFSYKINLYTDSNYLKNGITTWIKSWKKNNWINSNKKPVANQDLWKELDNINKNLKINWEWVKAHENNFYNNLADKHAFSAMKSQKEIKLKNGQIINN
tara:strand:- start:1382 stop:1855 length:474 start_codon:yes stop_codon:yes gene_type:complete